MGLAEIFTGCCKGSAPKSPPVPTEMSPKTKAKEIERKADANASDKTIVEVLPCQDVTNVSTPDQPSPKPTSHAEGFAVNQVKSKPEKKPRVKLEEDSEDPVNKLVLECFGFEVSRMLASKAWDERSQAIASVKEKCISNQIPEGVSQEKFVDGCCKFTMLCLCDKVMPIYFDTLELAKYLFGQYFVEQQNTDVINSNLEELLPVIIGKTADRNARSNEGTRQVLTFLARTATVGCSAVMAHIFTPITNCKEVSAIRGRLELINHMIDDFGFGKTSTISMQLVMGFVRPHLDATDEKVRRAAIEVTVNCYKHKGDRTLKYITNVKPALLKHLEARFAELERPAKGSRKNAKSAQGLPAVRGKPRVKAPPKRDTTSQPSMGAGANQSFFNREPVIGREDAPRGNDRTEDLNNVLKDCSQLFSMGNTMTMSPLSNTAVGPLSRENGPFEQSCFQPQHDPNFIGSPHEGLGLPGSMGAQMDDHLDLDADLMDEIESY